MGGQRMPIGHEEKAFVAELERQPVVEHPMIVPQVQPAGWPHTGQHALVVGKNDAQRRFSLKGCRALYVTGPPNLHEAFSQSMLPLPCLINRGSPSVRSAIVVGISPQKPPPMTR